MGLPRALRALGEDRKEVDEVSIFDDKPWDSVPEAPELDIKPEEYTCYDCPEKHTCEWAWDDYNTQGDCLATK